MVENVVADAAEEHRADGAAAAGAHDDEVVPALFDLADERGLGRLLADHRGDRDVVRDPVAGTRQVVGLGSSWASKVRVRKANDEANPDNHPLGNGMVRVNADQVRAKALLEYKER